MSDEKPVFKLGATHTRKEAMVIQDQIDADLKAQFAAKAEKEADYWRRMYNEDKLDTLSAAMKPFLDHYDEYVAWKEPDTISTFVDFLMWCRDDNDIEAQIKALREAYRTVFE